MKLYILLDKVGHNPEFESLQKALIRSITGLPKSALMQYNTFASKFSSDKMNSTAKEKTAAKKIADSCWAVLKMFESRNNL